MTATRTVLKALRTRFWDERPFILSHLVTTRCNADCLTCLWKQPASASTGELSTAEVRALYRQAARAGFTALVLWGGEPFVRRDLGALTRAAREAALDTSLITNGWWLYQRGGEVLPWIDRLLVSVDGIGRSHDRARRLPGLFERLDRGLVRARREHPGLRVILIAVVSRLNAEHLEEIAAYGAKHGTQVLFQAMNTSDYGFAQRSAELDAVQLDADAYARAALEIDRLRRAGYPVRNSNHYLIRLGDEAFRYRCHYKKVSLRVEPNGDILDCTRDAVTLANVRQRELGEFIDSPTFRDFVARSTSCNRCRDAGVIEASHIWEGRPGAILNAVQGLF